MSALLEFRRQYESGQLSKAEFIERMHHLHARLFDYPDQLRDCDISKIQITADSVTMLSRSGLTFYVDPVDRRSPPIEAINFGCYEADAELFWSVTSPGQVVLDIGANIGWYALHAAARFPTSTIHAFEPVPQTFDYLQRNSRSNKLANLALHNFGLSDHSGEVEFFVYREGPGGASLVDTSGRHSVSKCKARVCRLDDLGLTPDVIKIDVEGSELLVLRGGISTIRHARPAIFAEMLRKWAAKFGYHPNDILDLLGAEGYSCYFDDGSRIQRLSHMTDDVGAKNFLFLHKERHVEMCHRIELT